jgi:hypothetical protein
VGRGKIFGIASAAGGRRESMEKVSDAFVMLEKGGLPQVHIQNVTLLRE